MHLRAAIVIALIMLIAIVRTSDSSHAHLCALHEKVLSFERKSYITLFPSIVSGMASRCGCFLSDRVGCIGEHSQHQPAP